MLMDTIAASFMVMLMVDELIDAQE